MHKPSVLIVLALWAAFVLPPVATATDLDAIAWESPSATTGRELAATPGVTTLRDGDAHRSYAGGTLAGLPVQSWRFTLAADHRPPRLVVRFDPAANATAYASLHRLLADKHGSPDEFENAVRRDALWTLGPSAVLPGQTRRVLLTTLASGPDAHTELVFLDQPAPPPGTPRSDIRYRLHRDPHPTPDQLDAYRRITEVMDRAVRFYNEFTVGLVKFDTAYLSPDEKTAAGNINGNIRFGPRDISLRTALHEIAHTVGIGTTDPFERLRVDGYFTGKHALAELADITGAIHPLLRSDISHFFPYGLTYTGDDQSIWDYINHCRMVSAICQDIREYH